MFQVKSVADASVARQIRMEQNVVAQTVGGNRIVLVIGSESLPVFIQFLGAQYKHGLVAVLVIFDNCKCRECLSQTYTVRQDTTVVFLQFVDDGKSGIALEIVEFVPNETVLESGTYVG